MKEKIQYSLARYLKRKGITIWFVSKATGIQYELLRRSLNGSRVLTADELVSILRSTNITLADFIDE